MKLLIDIPDNDYKQIKEYYEKNDIVEATYSYIYHGIPQKIGHWVRVTDKTGHLVWECDNCGWQQRFNTNYCPDCGIKMIKLQESEDKNDKNINNNL